MVWTICFLVTPDNKVWLGLKLRGHGEGRWNGSGGKLKDGETPEKAAARETFEEFGVRMTDFRKVAELDFVDLPTNETNSAFAYICTKWEGTPRNTTGEMDPKLFEMDKVPYKKMWSADRIWMPLVLEKHKTIKGRFEYEKGDVLTKSTISEVIF